MRLEKRVHPELFAIVWAWVREHAADGEAFSQAEVIHALDGDVSGETTRKALVHLHAAEAIRRAGKKQGPSGHKSEAFKLLDVEAGDKAVKDSEATYDGPSLEQTRAGRGGKAEARS
jgi:hypothetical protein